MHPINLPLNHLPGCPHLSRFFRAAWVRPITGDKHPGGLHGADGVDHLLGGVGAAPGDEEDGCVEGHFLFTGSQGHRVKLLMQMSAAGNIINGASF